MCPACNTAVETVGGVRSLESWLWAAYKWQQQWQRACSGREWSTTAMYAWIQDCSGGKVGEWFKKLRVLVPHEAGMAHPKLLAVVTCSCNLHFIRRLNRCHVVIDADFHQLLPSY